MGGRNRTPERSLYLTGQRVWSVPEKVLFESEQMASRSDVASYLRTVADRLDAGEAVSLEAGEETISMDPPETVEFEVKAEREGPTDSPGELSLELELEWDETDSEDGSLSVS